MAALLVAALSVIGAASTPAGAAGDNISVPDPLQIGDTPAGGVSLALDSLGNPVVAYFEPINGDLRVLHCNDPVCDGLGDTVSTPVSDGIVGVYPSLALDAQDRASIAYLDLDYQPGEPPHAELLVCNDPGCVGTGDRTSILDNIYYVEGPALVLDDAGLPVIAFPGMGGEVHLQRCDDRFCKDGGDWVFAVETASDGTAGFVDLVLTPGEELPIIAYRDETNGLARFALCDDPRCSRFDDAAEVFVGNHVSAFPSLELVEEDDGGYTVYLLQSTVDATLGPILRIDSCIDGVCPQLGRLDAPLVTGELPLYGSLALGENRQPIAAYVDGLTGQLRIASFDQSGKFETVLVNPDPSASGELFPSLVLDADGNAVVAYLASDGLRLLRCSNESCRPSCNGLPITIDAGTGQTGTAGNDVIRGTSGDDIIDGGGGGDIICGLAGNDVLIGGAGYDKIFAGAGNDIIRGGRGNDRLVGGPGHDTISGSSGNDRLIGGPGHDHLSGEGDDDRVSGGGGNDQLFGGDGNDQLFGNLGRDTIEGGGGNDIIKGGAWLDTVDGGDGDDDRCGIVAGETRINCERGVFGI